MTAHSTYPCLDTSPGSTHQQRLALTHAHCITTKNRFAACSYARMQSCCGQQCGAQPALCTTLCTTLHPPFILQKPGAAAALSDVQGVLSCQEGHSSPAGQPASRPAGSGSNSRQTRSTRNCSSWISMIRACTHCSRTDRNVPELPCMPCCRTPQHSATTSLRGARQKASRRAPLPTDTAGRRGLPHAGRAATSQAWSHNSQPGMRLQTPPTSILVHTQHRRSDRLPGQPECGLCLKRPPHTLPGLVIHHTTDTCAQHRTRQMDWTNTAVAEKHKAST
jgi:hypothetical protein